MQFPSPSDLNFIEWEGHIDVYISRQKFVKEIMPAFKLGRMLARILEKKERGKYGEGRY